MLKSNWENLENQSLDQTINTLSMASPFSLEEKQILLETVDVKNRKNELEKSISTLKHKLQSCLRRQFGNIIIFLNFNHDRPNG